MRRLLTRPSPVRPGSQNWKWALCHRSLISARSARISPPYKTLRPVCSESWEVWAWLVLYGATVASDPRRIWTGVQAAFRLPQRPWRRLCCGAPAVFSRVSWNWIISSLPSQQTSTVQGTESPCMAPAEALPSTRLHAPPTPPTPPQTQLELLHPAVCFLYTHSLSGLFPFFFSQLLQWLQLFFGLVMNVLVFLLELCFFDEYLKIINDKKVRGRIFAAEKYVWNSQFKIPPNVHTSHRTG